MRSVEVGKKRGERRSKKTDEGFCGSVDAFWGKRTDELGMIGEVTERGSGHFLMYSRCRCCGGIWRGGRRA